MQLKKLFILQGKQHFSNNPLQRETITLRSCFIDFHIFGRYIYKQQIITIKKQSKTLRNNISKLEYVVEITK